MNISEQLRKEMHHCHAPVTGYLVACAIQTNQGIYLGHNNEKEHPTIFEHAEIVALKNMLQGEEKPQIQRMVMLGGGNVKKMKHYIPCFSCTEALAPYLTPETQIELLPLKDFQEGLTITAGELTRSYQDLPYSKFTSTTPGDLLTEAKNKTLLTEKDLRFIVDLALLGKEAGINFYLTGSSTGRGAVSTLILTKTGGTYQDLDIIAVTEQDPLQVEQKIEACIERHYGTFEKTNRAIPLHHNPRGVVVRKSFYHHTLDQPGIIDLTLSRDFKGAFCYRQYELKNWFHQLS